MSTVHQETRRRAAQARATRQSVCSYDSAMDFTSLPPGVLGNYDERFKVYSGTSSVGDRAVVISFMDSDTEEEHWFGLTPKAARKLARDLQRYADPVDGA